VVTSSRALSQVTHETVTHDAKGGSLSVWWDPGRTALVSEPTAYPSVTVSPRSFSTVLEPRYVTSNKCELACRRSRTANTPALLVRRASGECGEEATRRK